MKLDLRKKRFLISIVLLLCGVFALYPYLVSNPGRDLLKSVSRLDKPLAASVMRSVSLGQALVEKGREQAAASGHEQAVAVLTEKIGANVENLKKELLAMPPHSTQLSPGARTAYETLEAQLTDFIVSLAESGK
ncbi:hypothetical protein [Pyramidobacter sp.]|uniref:hypothetical protein n=1 Tax=Pyramidobacter sp. TaxID=1943581 RepID=UPI0025D709B2|nr:hypothetical protein [Pyramidobacter sp.]MCI7404251.1 hypothetical protein [Pyramidobacter sp.]MDY3213111.1 hypothetical protein [Pyramidobacter sp.]